jgi:hypothetical protein
MEEKYPPGTRVEWMDPSTHMLLAGTVMDIPILIDDSASTLVLLPTALTLSCLTIAPLL